MRFSNDQSYEAKFFKHIESLYAPLVDTANPDGFALFLAIQSAFSGILTHAPDRSVSVDPELISHLAACGWVALMYNRNQRIPWDASDHDYIIGQTFDCFVRSLMLALRKGHVLRTSNENLVCGDLILPSWFEQWAAEWTW
ncbi:MAG: hypothetical protein AAB343_01435 [Patescibacteria group bacterium]